MPSIRSVSSWATASLVFLLPTAGRASVMLVNGQGAGAPCIGIGPIGGPAAEYCAKLFEQAGFIRVSAAGVSGLTLGRSGAQDAVVLSVDPGSPAAESGVVPGDAVVAVDGRPVKPTLGRIAAERTFGPRGGVLHLKLMRAGAELDRTLTRMLEPTPNAPTSSNPLVGLHPLVNWRGDFVPCLGIGPLGLAALAYCTNKYKPYGFIKTDDAGATGLEFDLDRDSAVVVGVQSGSAAASADVRVGDEIIAVEGKPLSGSSGDLAVQQLFGRIGDSRRLTVRRNGAEQTFAFVLAGKSAR